MEKDDSDEFRTLEALIRKLLERSLGEGDLRGGAFRIIIAGGGMPPSSPAGTVIHPAVEVLEDGGG